MDKGLRFDVVEAYYIWLCTHHCGIVGRPYLGDGIFAPVERHSEWWMSYNRLSMMPTRLQFKPSPGLEYETLTERGKEIHINLCRRGAFCDCLEEKTCASSVN